MKWQSVAAHWGPWCGIIVPGTDALVNGVVAAVQPNYHPLNDYISDLSAPDVCYSWLIRAWWIAFPVLFFPFAVALHYHVRQGKYRWAPAVLLVWFSIGLCSCGIFHCDPGCQGKTTSAKVHFASSYTAAAALYLSPLALILVSWNDERWKGYQWINIAALFFGAGVGIALFLSGKHIIPHRGLWERLYFGVFYIWVVLLALRMSYLERTLPTFS